MSVYWEHHGAAYVRMAMAGIACYDYLRRLPDEYQLYFEKIDGRRFRFRLSAVLFALIRYVSIAALVTDNYGFFKHNFTRESCRIFFRVPIVLKVVQAMICQFIIGVRTYSIARRSVAVRNFLVVFYLVITGLEWFVAMYARHSVTTWGNCQSGTHLPVLINWLFAVFRVVFDVVAIAISTYYLVIANRASHGGLSALIKGMLYDGIGFLFVVACANTFHVTYHHHSVDGKQPPSLTTSIVFTWIMSQNILLNTRDAANGRGRWAQSNFQPSAGTVTAHVDISFARPSGDSYSTECEHKSDKTRVSPMEP